MKIEEEIVQRKFKNDHEKLVVNLYFTFSWMNEILMKRFKPFEITGQQYNILRILRGQHPKPASVKLLKERMIDKMSDVSRLVEKLKIKGLVDRYSCSSDRRSVDVIITEKGLEVLQKIDESESETFKHFENISKEEIKQLNFLLDKLRG